MAKPILYFQGTNAGSLPSTQEEFRWTEETELGTILTGDGLTTGINLGALTNAQSSGDFEIIISHNATQPVTGVKFYYQPTTNVRTGGEGFTHSDDSIGATSDFDEIRQWGTDSFNAVSGTSAIDGMYLKFVNETEDPLNCQFRDGFIDSLENSKQLNGNAKPGGQDTDQIVAFNNFGGDDYARFSTRLFVPDSLEDPGKRQISLVCRLTYSF